VAKQPPKPTASELDILRVLWDRGPSTVREVQDVLAETKAHRAFGARCAPFKRNMGYTTVLKLLQIMTAKGMVKRDEDARAHIYQARQPAGKTKRQLVGDLLERAFSGSASDLMLHALSGSKTSRQEIEEIRRMLNEYESKAEDERKSQ
jgi:BlaI family penicillinase repressor